jgi:hypothetical protein
MGQSKTQPANLRWFQLCDGETTNPHEWDSSSCRLVNDQNFSSAMTKPDPFASSGTSRFGEWATGKFMGSTEGQLIKVTIKWTKMH